MKTKEVEAALLRKGFRQSNTHHRYFIYHTASGIKTAVKTYTSQGSKALDDYLIGQMAKQCRLTKSLFGQLIECPLSQAQYEAALVAAGHVTLPPAGEPKS